jgi:hypothetical protein
MNTAFQNIYVASDAFGCPRNCCRIPIKMGQTLWHNGKSFAFDKNGHKDIFKGANAALTIGQKQLKQSKEVIEVGPDGEKWNGTGEKLSGYCGVCDKANYKQGADDDEMDLSGTKKIQSSYCDYRSTTRYSIKESQFMLSSILSAQRSIA